MNREQLRQRILFLLNEDITDPVFITTTQVNAMIQEALEIITEEVSDLKKTAFFGLEQGRFLYTLGEIAPDVMAVERIWSHADETRLKAITMRELDNAREQWMEVKSSRPDWWFPVSHDAWGIHPGPNAGGDLLRIDYIAWAEELQNDTDTPILNESEEDLVVLYGQYDGLIRQWEVERGIDIFTIFVQSFRDQTFKRETRRFQHVQFNRHMSNSGGTEL